MAVTVTGYCDPGTPARACFELMISRDHIVFRHGPQTGLRRLARRDFMTRLPPAGPGVPGPGQWPTDHDSPGPGRGLRLRSDSTSPSHLPPETGQVPLAMQFGSPVTVSLA